MSKRILCVMKFGQREHMESLQNGKLYCRHLSYYADSENKMAHFHDSMEGIQGQYPAEEVKITINPGTDKSITLDSSNGLTRFVRRGLKIRQPAFCLYAIHVGDWDKELTDKNKEEFVKSLSISSRMKGFTNQDETYVWVLLNGTEFNKRIRRATKKLGIDVRARMIEYRPIIGQRAEVQAEDVGFVKDISFQHEKEYRYIFDKRGHILDDPFVLDLGSLKDISVVLSFEELVKSISFSFAETPEEYHNIGLDVDAQYST